VAIRGADPWSAADALVGLSFAKSGSRGTRADQGVRPTETYVILRIVIELAPYRDTWAPDDPHANFKAEVANYTTADPLPTLERLSAGTGIPVESLIRYVLVKWAASGSEAMLAMGPIVFQQMRDIIDGAERDGSNDARLKAYEALKQILGWLAAGPTGH
jgi:hypothetical protein